jgi:hypothetical protein
MLKLRIKPIPIYPHPLPYTDIDPRLAALSKDEVLEVMHSVGFRDDGKAKPHHAVSTLSGGWR